MTTRKDTTYSAAVKTAASRNGLTVASPQANIRSKTWGFQWARGLQRRWTRVAATPAMVVVMRPVVGQCDTASNTGRCRSSIAACECGCFRLPCCANIYVCAAQSQHRNTSTRVCQLCQEKHRWKYPLVTNHLLKEGPYLVAWRWSAVQICLGCCCRALVKLKRTAGYWGCVAALRLQAGLQGMRAPQHKSPLQPLAATHPKCLPSSAAPQEGIVVLHPKEYYFTL